MLAIALLAPAPARADPLDRWATLIEDASLRFGVPAAWIGRVMRLESGGQTVLDGRPIRSRKGAIGLMQLMPGTWADMRAQLGLGDDPDDPRDNILAGAFYLRLMYHRFGYPGLFGAYNAGPARYAAWLAGRQPLPAETVNYMTAAAGSDAARRLRPTPTARLFAARNADTPRPAHDTLFAIRRPAP
jgi:soluble lytic murein transglycosylase-like protein